MTAAPGPRDFRCLASGQALSWLGNGFQTVALATAVVLSGGGPGQLGTVMACSVVAMLLATLFGGVWADRLQPVAVMVVSDVVRLVAAGATALLFLRPGTHLLPLCALTALASGAGAFFTPAMTALKPALVPVERRQAANATLGLLQTSTRVLGPAAGGLVVAAFGASTGFAVNAASYLASVVGVLLIRARVERTAPRRGMLREMGEGWAEIRRRDWLLSGVLAATVYHVANGIVLVLAPVLAVSQLGGARAAGLVVAAEGLGGVVGSAVALRYRPRHLLLVGWSALLLMALWPSAFVWPGDLVAVMGGAAVGYAGLSYYGVSWDTSLQDHVPHAVLARVDSWDLLTSFIAMPVGSALAGPLSAQLGDGPLLLGCAAVLLLASASPLLVPGTRRLTRVEHGAPAPDVVAVPVPPLDPAAPVGTITTLDPSR
ncbi:MAG: MFS transporter [Motilibacteraceae bacterium]